MPALESWRVGAEIAAGWAAGFLTDFALRTFQDPASPALYVAWVHDRAALRQLRALLLAERPPILLWRSRFDAPAYWRRAVAARVAAAGFAPTHTDEWGDRYQVNGVALAAFITSLDQINNSPLRRFNSFRGILPGVGR